MTATMVGELASGGSVALVFACSALRSLGSVRQLDRLTRTTRAPKDPSNTHGT
jgi:hypothetical protein